MKLFIIVISLWITGCTTSPKPKKLKEVSPKQKSSQMLLETLVSNKARPKPSPPSFVKSIKYKTKSILNVNEKQAVEALKEEKVHLLENLFADELYFEKDKVGVDKTAVVIKYLRAYPWEKKALKEIYREHKHLWSKQQSKSFKKILQEDRYASLCGDHAYWENLEFEESEPEQDILQSVLLLKYINNLTHGCVEWVESDGKVKDENREKPVEAKYILSLLPYNVLIKKLFLIYTPKKKRFKRVLSEYKALVESDATRDKIKEKRLLVEQSKITEIEPNYRKKER